MKEIPLTTDKLLTISDISEILGVSPVTASKFMKESGRAISVHRRLYVLSSSFYEYLKEIESK